MGAIFENFPNNEEISINNLRFDSASYEKARLEYLSNNRELPAEDDEKIMIRAAEIFKEKIEAVSKKYSQQTVQTVQKDQLTKPSIQSETVSKQPEIPNFKLTKQDIERMKLTKIQTEKIKKVPEPIGKLSNSQIEPTIPKFPEEKNPKTIEVDTQQLKGKSVGNKKNEKSLSIRIVSAGIALLMAGSLAIKLKTYFTIDKGQTGTESVYNYYYEQWYGENYSSSYQFHKMGRNIVENSYNTTDNSKLSIEDNIAMAFGYEANEVVIQPNNHGVPSQWHYESASHQDEEENYNGWADKIYSGIKESAEEHGLFLPDTLEEYLKDRKLDKYIYYFDDFSGIMQIKEIDELSEEKQQYYQTVGGMLENLNKQSKALAYRNGRAL